eukprot:1157244-Pelagomonas_calceolata.AAC.7
MSGMQLPLHAQQLVGLRSPSKDPGEGGGPTQSAKQEARTGHARPPAYHHHFWLHTPGAHTLQAQEPHFIREKAVEIALPLQSM